MTTQQRLILVLVVAAVLAGLTASATAQPFSGGLPLCQRNVNTCNASLATCSTSLNQVQASLTTCNTDLNACNTQLSECQAAAQNAPPGAGVEVILNFEDLRADNTQVNLHGPVYGGVGRNPLESFAADICTPPTQDCFSLVARHFSPVANPPRFTTLVPRRSRTASHSARPCSREPIVPRSICSRLILRNCLVATAAGTLFFPALSASRSMGSEKTDRS